MTEILDSIRLLYETSVEEADDGYVIPIPDELVENSSLSVDEAYRIALLAATNTSTERADLEETETEPSSQMIEAKETTDQYQRRDQSPPVEEGEIRSVTIDTLGDQGDGIAKVERGFIVIVPETQPGDQIDVKITDVKDTVAFAEPVSETTVR